MQFGFVPGRSTAMAESLVHDVCEYSKTAGFYIFLCSLDAEAAYDGIPHPVLFETASTVLPDVCWKILYKWYTNLSVNVKWQDITGSIIKVTKGHRQGGLISPMLYNVFYQPLVDKLSSCNAGITIHNQKYNVFCYADDLLLASTTATGLQTLINIAVNHVSERGLSFNPTETVCMSYGKHTFVKEPMWKINENVLENNNNLKYLGTELGRTGGNVHTINRIKCSNRAFYSLRGSGLHSECMSTSLVAHVYSTAVRSSLLYGCHTVKMSKSDLVLLNKTQANHIRSALGLRSYCHIKSILRALGINLISDTIAVSSLELLRTNLRSMSATSAFYLHLLSCCNHLTQNTLVTRAITCFIIWPHYIPESYWGTSNHMT